MSIARPIPWLTGFWSYCAWLCGKALWRSLPVRSGSAIESVCVIQPNALGDTLMATPLLHALVDAVGPGRVDVVVASRSTELLRNLPGLGRLITVQRHLRWRDFRSILEYVRVLRDVRARRYDAVIDLSRVLQFAWMTYLAAPRRSIGVQVRRNMGPRSVERLEYLYTDEVAVPSGQHIIHEHLALLKPLGIRGASDKMIFVPTELERQDAQRWLKDHDLVPGRPYVVIHPSGKWPPKRWHAERFRDLTQRLKSQGLSIVLAGDAWDRSLCASIAQESESAIAILAGELSLGAVGALIEGASLFIGNDSALMHMASAVSTPLIALFGPTVADHTGPLGAQNCVIAKPIECRPCQLYFTQDRCARGHNYCMDLIEVDEVLARAKARLRRADCALAG